MDQSIDHQMSQAEQERFARQASEIVALMSLAEKVALMSGDRSIILQGIDMRLYRHYNRVPYSAGGNKRLGVPPLKFCDDPRGVVPGHATCFPAAGR